MGWGQAQRASLWRGETGLLGLKCEATRFKKRNISATIVADVKRFGHPIKRMRFSAHTGRASC